MKILYVTSYPLEYNTSANIRNQGLINGLIKNGHEVYTLSPYPNDLRFFSGELLNTPFAGRFWLDSPSEPALKKDTPQTHIKLKTWLLTIYSTFSVYDRRSSYAKRVDGLTIGSEEYDIMISSSDPKSAHLVAEMVLKRSKGRIGKWIQYWGDPFLNDVSHDHLLQKNKIRREERRLLSKADKIVYVSPFTAEELESNYPEYKNKIAFLPIPYIDAPEMPGSACVGTEYVAYMGNYGSVNRNIMPLIDAVNSLNVHTAIIGNSDVKIEPNEHLIIKERIPSKELEEFTKKVKVFVCICNKKGTQIPGKVYHYVNSGKPILIILDGDRIDKMKEYFESFDRFYLCGNNQRDIESTLKTILSENKVFSTPDALNPTTIAEKFIKL